jgi:hypothetical protein
MTSILKLLRNADITVKLSRRLMVRHCEAVRR